MSLSGKSVFSHKASLLVPNTSGYTRYTGLSMSLVQVLFAKTRNLAPFADLRVLDQVVIHFREVFLQVTKCHLHKSHRLLGLGHGIGSHPSNIPGFLSLLSFLPVRMVQSIQAIYENPRTNPL